MLRAIQRFFESRIDPGHRDIRPVDGHRLQVATGALLIEVMRTDVESTEGERAVVLAALQRKFDLTPEETQELMELAEAEADEVHRPLSVHFSHQDRFFPRAEARRWWSTCGPWPSPTTNLDKHEEHLVRKIASLIGVSHKEFIEAKLRARDGAGAI